MWVAIPQHTAPAPGRHDRGRRSRHKRGGYPGDRGDLELEMNNTETPSVPEVRQMISISDALKRIPMSRSTLGRKVKEGTRKKRLSSVQFRTFLETMK